METPSDEESFVILGSSPTPSLQQDGNNGQQSQLSSLQSDATRSNFSSLRSSQLAELKCALESPTKISTENDVVSKQIAESRLWSRPQIEASKIMEQSATANNLLSNQQSQKSLQSNAPSSSLTNGQQLKQSALQSGASFSNFSPLKSSQLEVLKSALESAEKNVTPCELHQKILEKLTENKLLSCPQTETSRVMEQSANNLLSTPQVEPKVMPITLVDCALKSHLQGNHDIMEKEPTKEFKKSVELQGARDSPTQNLTPKYVMKQLSDSELWSRPQIDTSQLLHQSAASSDLWSILNEDSFENCTSKQSINGVEKDPAKESLNNVTKSTSSYLNTTRNGDIWSILNEDSFENCTSKQSINGVEKDPAKESLNNVTKSTSSYLNTTRNFINTNIIKPKPIKTSAVSTSVNASQTISATSNLNTPQNSINTNVIEPSPNKTAAALSDLCSISDVGSFESCTFQSPSKQSVNGIEKDPYNVTNSATSNLNTPQNSINTNAMESRPSKTASASTSVNTNLASSFIMGDVNADVLKTSIYSQFPSFSVDASKEDIVKLQNMFTEYLQLKITLDKVNNTMKLFYNNSMQWKEKINHMEKHYTEELNECQSQIEMLRKENQDLKQNFEVQVEHTKALDVARQKDREESIKEISEKNAILENMRAQIVKLEKQQMTTSELTPTKSMEKTNGNFNNLYITRGEHELIVKNLRLELSELLARNLDFTDVEKQYVDELNCLKVNLTSAEEIIKQTRAEIAELRALDAEKQKKIENLEISNNQLRVANSEQNERIVVLEHQNEVHRKDFEMERQSRETAVGEKHQLLQDLRGLQKKNQDIIDERQKLLELYEKSKESLLATLAAGRTTHANNLQRSPSDLTPPSPNVQAETSPINRCPVCNKGFKSLNVLQAHVNACIDKQ